MIECTFKNPVYWDNENIIPVDSQTGSAPWQFSGFDCENEAVELIQDGEVFFYIDRTASYGEFMTITILLFFFGFFLLKWIIGLFFPVIVRYSKKWS